jgi:flagellar motor switch/type III secretory pathway protein FliN
MDTQERGFDKSRQFSVLPGPVRSGWAYITSGRRAGDLSVLSDVEVELQFAVGRVRIVIRGQVTRMR